jgi:hypothetical protein
MDSVDEQMRSMRLAEEEARERKLKRKKQELSSTTAPPKYWAQGKVYIISNEEGTAFFHGDSNDDEFNYVTDIAANASIHLTIKEVKRVITAYSELDRGDFVKGKEGLKLFNLFQNAKAAVLVFKVRDVRLKTHLQEGD